MHRSHPLYIAAAIVLAIAIQLVLAWKFRSSVKHATVPSESRDTEEP